MSLSFESSGDWQRGGDDIVSGFDCVGRGFFLFNGFGFFTGSVSVKYTQDNASSVSVTLNVRSAAAGAFVLVGFLGRVDISDTVGVGVGSVGVRVSVSG